MAEGAFYCLFVRDGCIGMVPRSEDFSGFAACGSTGLSLDEGLGYLVWHEDQPFFKGQGFEIPALPAQVVQVRQFTTDLEEALGQTFV